MRILISYDGSECAGAAIRDLGRAGLPAEAQAVVLTVADLLVEVPYAGYGVPNDPACRVPATLVERARAAATAAMNSARQASARGADLLHTIFPKWTVRAEAQADVPYWGVSKKAEQWPADLIVVGSHGRSLLGWLILGSVSQNVLSHAPCSVRIGRRPANLQSSGANLATRLLVAVDDSPDSAEAVKAVAARP